MIAPTKYSVKHDYRAAHDSGPRPLSAIELFVVHDMEVALYDQAAEAVGRFFESGGAQASTHYGIDDNSIQMYLASLAIIPWGAPHANLNGIHYELMGKAAWTHDQWMKHKGTLDRAAWLLAKNWTYLRGKGVGVPLRKLTDAELKAGKKGITTHRQVARVFGGTHTDPGSNFPMDWLVSKARYYAGLK